MNQLTLFAPIANPDTETPKSATWQGYTPDVTDKEAQARYNQKHGDGPCIVQRSGGAVLVRRKEEA